ncbi:MAG: ABC transporter ATP-binding protein [Clostridiales bacterium]|nr:ABC transporter ATP-binding protein [Clostridiales bacterium]
MIEVKNVSKNYGPVPAVKDISFTVEKGHIYGFLGPNGAGKSTTMNMITGCLAATSGTITIDGHDIYSEAIEAKRHIGYLPEQPPLYTDMTPFEYLSFVGRAKGLSKADLYDQMETVMEKTGITDVADRLIRNLSKGYKQRVGIAQAILGDPDVIILDEPTVGLDPIQIVEIRQLIQDLGQEHTVILSSHILQEISAVCDWVIMISKGKIVASDTMENLLASAADSANIIKLETEGDADTVQEALQKISGVKNVSVSEKGGRLSVTVETEPDVQIGDDIFMGLRHAGLPVHSMTDSGAGGQNTLEDLFIQLAGESLDAGAAYAAEKAAKKEKKEKKSEQKPVGETTLGSAYYSQEDDASSENAEATEDDTYEPLFEKKEDDDQ